MYCPNCGAKTSTDQNFCRACGLRLEKIAASLAEQLPTKVDLTIQQKKERYEKIGMALLSVFGLGLLSFILYSVVYKLMLTKGDILTGLAMIGFLVMVVCGLASVILFAKAKEVEEGKPKHLQPANLANGRESTKELLTEGNFEPVPSVTDRTTDLLTVEKRERKL